MGVAKTSLLDPAFLRKLERLRIQARRAFPGSMRGERRSTRRGASVEFADFRKYEAGDDFRHVDWNIYARLERLMLRQFVEEEDVRIDILIDRSRSMQFGKPLTKFDFARRAAAALAFLAVGSLDRVGVSTFDSAIRTRMQAMRGRGHLLSVLAFLDSLSEKEEKQQDDGGALPSSKNVKPEGEPPVDESSNEARAVAEVAQPDGPTNLSATLRAYQRSRLRPGILFVISDFLDPVDFRTEMKLLAHRGFDLNLIQVLAREELEPEIEGDLLLLDSETGEQRELTINDQAISAYRAALAEFTTSLESFSRAFGIGYTMVATDASFEDMLLKNLIESKMTG